MKKNRHLIILLFALALSSTFCAQEKSSLEDQFTEVIDKSNRYEDYKVVKIYKLNELRKSVLDSVKGLEATIGTNIDHIQTLEGTIDSLKQSVNQLQLQLADSQKKEDGIVFFGLLLKKSTYQIILWTIIGALVLLSLILSYRFRNSNAITKASNLKLAETETEFEAHRQRALEREQQLRRKLQDEINKQKSWVIKRLPW